MDRARQFMPFSPLKGFYELIEEKEIIPEEKMVLSQEDYDKLSFKINRLKKGDMVKVKWYKENGYVELIGKVSNIDFENMYLIVVKEKIKIFDIVEIEY